MNNKRPILFSLLHAIAVIAYIILVVFIMNSVGTLFDEKLDNFWAPVLFLMLFVVSAAITGSIVLGRPIYLYLNDQKKEAITFLIYTITWLFLIMITVLAIYIIIS